MLSVKDLAAREYWAELSERVRVIQNPKAMREILWEMIRTKNPDMGIFRALLDKLLKKGNLEVGIFFKRVAERERKINLLPAGLIYEDWYEVCCEASSDVLAELLCFYEHHWKRTTGRCIPCKHLFVHSMVLSMVRSFFTVNFGLGYDIYAGSGKKIVLADSQMAERIKKIKSKNDLQRDRELYRLWHKICAFIRFGYPQDRITSVLLQGGEYIYPRILLWLASKVAPEEFCQRDIEDQIPLHIAANQNPYLDEEGLLEIVFLSDNKLSKLNSLDIVADIFPCGARYHDQKGRLPLAILLQSDQFMKWCEKVPTESKDAVEQVMRLVKLEPRALSTRDKVTHMYPFMMTHKKSSSGLDNIQTDTHRLNLAYCLLREDPSV
eukprot:CAMPEP_0183301246 /NCGR_PEP_ID=MMETSP0160_2-20130417/7417_1 /TAXON_ID=2839 ORGANISM="Odontella Sinensis, Strain Grunow 1884" /NCGR_SAMPLE_ID=MMETSP0160_2 /ASSEMBLY_ACC=CAM_ASM_000250 /LENGTH=379 /DNA_ID=CAMNT_0025463817 /DNA_START=180 /DNA_END=1316 /DNA_ORIENTATION=+